MAKEILLAMTLALNFGIISWGIRRLLANRRQDDFFPAFIILYSAKFIIMAGVLFVVLRFVSSNSLVCLTSFLAAFTGWKFVEVYSIYKQSAKAF